MKTYWVRTEREFKPARWDRCARVTPLLGGEYFVRTWRSPLKKRLVQGLKVKDQRNLDLKWARVPEVPWWLSAMESIVKRCSKRSFVVEIYILHRQIGYGPLKSALDTLKMRSQSREWKKILKTKHPRGHKAQEELYERLRKAPKLFE